MPNENHAIRFRAILARAFGLLQPSGTLPPEDVRVSRLRSALSAASQASSLDAVSDASGLPFHQRRSGRLVSGWPRFAVGGIGLMLLGLGYLGWQRQVDAPADGAGRQYATQAGQRATFTLPDGSNVILGPATTLTYAATSAGRTVGLDGEAYFTVTPSTRSVFAVIARDVRTQVLGTSFSVRSYETDAHVTVTVAEGKVKTESGVSEQVLVAGDMGIVHRDQRIDVTRNIRVTDAFGWTRGEKAFRNTRLVDLIPDLERMYDIRVRVTSSALTTQVLTVVLTDDPAADVVATIAAALGAHAHWEGNQVTLSDNNTSIKETR